jgi:hypothetical protein
MLLVETGMLQKIPWSLVKVDVMVQKVECCYGRWVENERRSHKVSRLAKSGTQNCFKATVLVSKK